MLYRGADQILGGFLGIVVFHGSQDVILWRAATPVFDIPHYGQATVRLHIVAVHGAPNCI